MKSNIVLIGMPGAGKSTLGVVLAKIANMRFLDADLLIQERHGKTLQELIDDNGTEGFIAIEEAELVDIRTEGTVIATGGSAVYSDEGMRHLAGTGTVVYLKIPFESLVERLGDLHERGVVMRGETDGEGGGDAHALKRLFDERRPLYERYADVTVNVDGLTISEAARAVREATI